MALELCDPRDAKLSLGILQGTLSNIRNTKPLKALACSDKVQETTRKVTTQAQAGVQ